MVLPADFDSAWSDATLDADSWWRLNNVTPLQAATLLCGFNPDDGTVDPLTVSTDKTSPDDFKRLLREFEDAAQDDSKPRTLSQWHDIAITRNLKHHTWIDDYKKTVVSGQVTKQFAFTRASALHSRSVLHGSTPPKGSINPPIGSVPPFTWVPLRCRHRFATARFMAAPYPRLRHQALAARWWLRGSGLRRGGVSGVVKAVCSAIEHNATILCLGLKAGGSRCRATE